MVKVIYVDKIMSDSEIAKKEGEYFNEDHYHTIVDEDVDVYRKHDGKLLLKLRKNCLSQENCYNAVDSLRDAAKKKHENRGASAGVLDRNKMANYIGEFVNPGKFRTRFMSSVSGKFSKQATSNLSPSNIIGYYDKPDRNLKGKGAPCRLTAFNRDYPELWEQTLPFLKECDNMFKKLTPEPYQLQYNRANETPDFSIEDTAFSTVTINYSWRTALHKDAGDFQEGFGNLIVLEDHNNPNEYKGCYTGFPQYGVAMNVRQGDFAAMDVHEWHCNTGFNPVDGSEVGGKWKENDVQNNWYFNRLSVVCYLRENMLRCKNMSTNKIQLLNRNTNKNPVFAITKKFPITKTLQDYEKISIELRNNLETSIFDSTKKEDINNNVADYFGYTGYYLADFEEDLEEEFVDTFISELGLYLNLNETSGENILSKDTLEVLNKVANQV